MVEYIEIMTQYKEILSRQLIGNSVQDWLIAIACFLGAYIALHIFRRVVIGKITKIAKRTSFKADDAIIQMLEGISGLFYFTASLFIASRFVSFSEIIEKVIYGLFVVVIVYEVIRILERVILFFVVMFWMGDRNESEKEHMSHILQVIIKIALWTIGAILVLSNLGFDVTSLVASLGVGGIAIALAVQNILGDMFSSFSIYFDQPFRVGDFIVVGDHMGTVKKIGLKTTRIEALQGEEIVISNAELTSSRVRNFKQMQKRRIPFVVGVTYDTPKNKLEKIPAIVKSIIDPVENAELDRVHLKEFGDSIINFEIVFYALTGDYAEYMNTRQEINLGLVGEFEKEGIEFAFPTQTLHVVKD